MAVAAVQQLPVVSYVGQHPSISLVLLASYRDNTDRCIACYFCKTLSFLRQRRENHVRQRSVEQQRFLLYVAAA